MKQERIYLIEIKNSQGIYEDVGIGTMEYAVELYWEHRSAGRATFIGYNH